MYTYNCVFFFFFGHISSCSPFVRNVGWGGHNSTVGVTLPKVWARSVQRVARGKPFELFVALGTLEANPRVSATSPGIGFLYPLSSCTHARFGCKPGFSARKGYPYIFLLLHMAPRYNPAAQQQPSPLAAAACNSMRV